jgi:hypothetical protein
VEAADLEKVDADHWLSVIEASKKDNRATRKVSEQGNALDYAAGRPAARRMDVTVYHRRVWRVLPSARARVVELPVRILTN